MTEPIRKTQAGQPAQNVRKPNQQMVKKEQKNQMNQVSAAYY